jgi:hypothetical protein
MELLARSPRMHDDWIDSLPAWRDQAHPGLPLVDAMVAAGILHSPAALMVSLVQAGTIQPQNLPVLITALGCTRLEIVLAMPVAVPVVQEAVEFDRFGAGEFIPLDDHGTASVAADEAAAKVYEAYDPGAFIAFSDEAEEAPDTAAAAVSGDKKASYETYEPGEFITFSDESDDTDDSLNTAATADKKASYETYEPGEFITFDDSES